MKRYDTKPTVGKPIKDDPHKQKQEQPSSKRIKQQIGRAGCGGWGGDPSKKNAYRQIPIGGGLRRWGCGEYSLPQTNKIKRTNG